MKFVKEKSNPVYGGPYTGTLFDVLVQKTSDGRFRMDFSWRPEKSLAVAFSEDGIEWSYPVKTLVFDAETGWEDNINRNCVLKDGDIWKMWYTGQARGYSYIGYAESEDGIRFKRYKNEPVLFPERPFEGMSVMNPCVLIEDGKYRMWYAAGETYEPNVIAYAESIDGINWKKLPFNPVYTAESGNDWEKNRVGGCQVLPHRELGYVMFYIGYKDINTACICCAASQNGITGWKRCKLNPLIVPEKNTWDEDSCYKPSALYDEKENKWRLWYNGRKGPDEYIGSAYMNGDFAPEDFISQK